MGASFAGDCFSCNSPFCPECFLGPSALSLEEQRLLQSLDRLNERLKGTNICVHSQCICPHEKRRKARKAASNPFCMFPPLAA